VKNGRPAPEIKNGLVLELFGLSTSPLAFYFFTMWYNADVEEKKEMIPWLTYFRCFVFMSLLSDLKKTYYVTLRDRQRL